MAESFASSSTQTGHSVRPPAAVPVSLRTLGCKVNQVESETIASSLLGMGCVLTAEDEARIVVVNSCTVTAEADRKVRKIVRHALQSRMAPVVVVTGCLAALDAEGITALGERVMVEPDSSRVGERVARLLGDVANVGGAAGADTGAGAVDIRPPAQTVFHTRAMVKVQDGCDAFCAYCVVPFARGVPRSVAIGDVIGRVRQLVRAGTREIVLTGINIGKYDDAPGGLAGLYRAVAETGIPRIRLSSIEPLDLDDELLAALSETPATCAHLHVPLQSGSDAVLRRMGRGYTAHEYEARVAAAREALPGLAVTTDVIAGLPGESVAEAAATRQFCEHIGFSKLHVFRYSARAGTVAAQMDGQVDPGERSRRARGLREVGLRLRDAALGAMVGAHAEVLVEETTVDDTVRRRRIGTTRDYARVEIERSEACAGDIVEVEIVGRGVDAELLGRAL
ncbi:MAG: tRNA (N(6)-L-threonylcarbamoyladenosine(37)-C(2))-methylthiotransferase MtaB [Actinomycetota bacterium]|nr:tRNA (N(6)-L-threonylcarbamoyladenosine(37)-C(2))-methylthiotransferase MtaB [Actinomycetota bacterium]